MNSRVHALGVLTVLTRPGTRGRCFLPPVLLPPPRSPSLSSPRSPGIVHHCVSLCVAEPGDLAIATHCSPLADNERSNSSNGITDSTDADGTAASKSYSPVHRIRRVSAPARRHLAARRSYRGLSGCRGSVFAAAECVDQKIADSVPRAARLVAVNVDGAFGSLAHHRPVTPTRAGAPARSDDRDTRNHLGRRGESTCALAGRFKLTRNSRVNDARSFMLYVVLFNSVRRILMYPAQPSESLAMSSFRNEDSLILAQRRIGVTFTPAQCVLFNYCI